MVSRAWWETWRSSHHDCLHFTADLERDIYGAVVSHSVQDHLDGCGFWVDISWLKMESIR